MGEPFNHTGCVCSEGEKISPSQGHRGQVLNRGNSILVSLFELFVTLSECVENFCVSTLGASPFSELLIHTHMHTSRAAYGTFPEQ